MYCYECAAQVSMPQATNIAWCYGDNDRHANSYCMFRYECGFSWYLASPSTPVHSFPGLWHKLLFEYCMHAAVFLLSILHCVHVHVHACAHNYLPSNVYRPELLTRPGHIVRFLINRAISSIPTVAHLPYICCVIFPQGLPLAFVSSS